MCNELPAGAITSNDLAPTPGKALLGLTHFVVNPSDISSSSTLQFTCKSEPTLLEIVTSQMGVFISATNAALQKVAPIDISTCLIHCSRCGLYLGDAKLDGSGKNEDDEIVYCQETNSNFSVSNPCCDRHRKMDDSFSSYSTSLSFSLRDTRSIKLRYDKINMRYEWGGKNDTLTICNVENLAIRSMLLLSEIHRVAHFRWRLTNEEKCTDETECIMSITIKIMNKDYLLDEIKATRTNESSSLSLPVFPSSLSSCQAVKLLFKENVDLHSTEEEFDGSPSLSIKSGCIELPIAYDDYIELKSILQRRSIPLRKSNKTSEENENTVTFWKSSALYLL